MTEQPTSKQLTAPEPPTPERSAPPEALPSAHGATTLGAGPFNACSALSLHSMHGRVSTCMLCHAPSRFSCIRFPWRFRIWNMENSCTVPRGKQFHSIDRQSTMNTINQNEKNKMSSTLLSLRLDAQPTVTY